MERVKERQRPGCDEEGSHQVHRRRKDLKRDWLHVKCGSINNVLIIIGICFCYCQIRVFQVGKKEKTVISPVTEL